MNSDKSLRDHLVDVGVELVTAEGSAALGLREIARRAGVSHGAPRRYFPTHHALLSAIAGRGFQDLGKRFAAAASGATGPGAARGQLAALAREYVSYARENRGMFELMFRHDLLDSEQHGSGERRLRESTLPLFGRIVELVARSRAERGAPPGLPSAQVTAAALWANLHGIAQLWLGESLPLVLGDAAATDGPRTGAPLDQLVTAALDAHLGPVAE
ncbi:TetR/AcrR family transcriptional regulator [Streptomyces sp. NPDC004111]|uniref:TetR/AcrR family transcriptional regulator n=1 Tax=Streptomyces sp. NPDC004111 TaxID=3364690 RepID=UPI0036B09DC5